MYFVDSDTCIYFMNGKYPSVRDKFLSISPKEIKVSSVVKAELLLGAYKSRNREQTTRKVLNFLKPFEIVPFTDEMTDDYAEIRSELEKSGKPIGANDYFIAATARYKKGIIVTNNADEFSRISKLELVNWVK
ncbi:type II toxin-antitoxin system VapC family toxin [Treponema socranskii subsp. buccale]|uniref:type II toxin-antitoxin system tRNA(fMet)-specific endonuclease VapC n=1 Tax=Treponema socranskii TaxID=53419 RepID=UPI0020A25783|nr:type II toxin-antitoxin system VapC family toxin [Treponema socranskii]UTD02785.1 type II toxin-antitoxin system VapC family toxin [Treponema socranskii subsp. buccale]